MSQDNVEIVRRGVEAFIENDFEAWFGLADPGIRPYPRPEEPGVKLCYEGWDEMLGYLVNWYSGWEDYTGEAQRFIDAGDVVVVDMREVGVAQAAASVSRNGVSAVASREKQKCRAQGSMLA